MASQSDGNDKLVTMVIGLIILGLLFLWLKKSGQLDEIRRALGVLSSQQQSE